MNRAVSDNLHFLRALARAFAGAIIFSIPMMMTMELWHLGFYVDKYRLALLMVLTLPMLAGLSYYIGFEDTKRLRDDVVDAFVAYAVGYLASGIVLAMFSVITSRMPMDEVVGKTAIMAVVAAIGAMLAQSELGGERPEEGTDLRRDKASYLGEIFLMLIGAVFLAMNLAPTEEMVLISHRMPDLAHVGLGLLSLLLMHGFVYAVGFHGQEKRSPEGSSFLSIFLRYTTVGYAVALMVSFYLLWTFGRTDGLSMEEMLKQTVVLGFPAALGAAASRLIL